MGTTILSDPQKQFHAVSLSGGKDSTAMLLLMIERGMPINMVLTADTGMEFPEMYAHLAIFAAIPRQTNPSAAIMRHTTPPSWNRPFSC